MTHAAFTPISLASFAIAIAAAFGNLVLLGTRYASLPEQVPTHYGFSGRPDAWGNKKLMWLMALMPLFTLFMMAGVAMRMVTTSGESNIDEVQTGLRILSTVTAYLSAGVSALTLRMLAVAEKHSDGIGALAAPIFIAGLALVIFLFR